MEVINKKYYKLIKKYGVIKVDDGNTQGVIKITRVVVSPRYSWTTSDSCEIDIEYCGTLEDIISKMGPEREIKPDRPDGGFTYRRRWYSKIGRNKCVRSRLSNDIRSRLAYLGLNLRYSHQLKIKKVVWNTTDIPQCDF
jgi:hypothetical protein